MHRGLILDNEMENAFSAQNGQLYNTVQKNEHNSTIGEWFD